MQVSGFARSIAVLAGGTAGAQILLAAASPLLTRLYEPRDFGGLAVYSSVLAIALIFACFRYELAIPLPTENVEALCLVAICLVSSFLVALILTIGIVFQGHMLVQTFNIEEIEPYLWALPLGIFAGGCYRAFYYYAVRQHEYMKVSRTRVFQVVAQLLVQIAGAGYGLGALVLAQVIGQSVGAPKLSLLALRSGDVGNMRWPTLKRMLLAYRRFPLFDTWSGLLNTAGQQIPPLFIAAHFGAASAGIYLLAMRILLLPFEMIGSAIGTSLHARGRDQLKAETLGTAVSQTLILCLKMALPGLAALFFLSPEIFPWLFGAEWSEGGVLVQLLIPMVLVRFCTSPISVVAFIHQRQKALLVWQLIYCLVTFASLYFTQSLGFREMVWWYSMALTACYLILGLGIVLSVGAPINLIIPDLAKCVGLSFLISLPLLIIYAVNAPLWVDILCLAAFVVALAVYYWQVVRGLMSLELGRG